MTQRKHILLVELLHAEYARAHSTNVMRSLCIVIVLIIAAVGPGLNPHISQHQLEYKTTVQVTRYYYNFYIPLHL